MEPKNKRPTIVILFRTKANQFRLIIPPTPTSGHQLAVERRDVAGLGEIVWIPVSRNQDTVTQYLTALALSQIGAGLINPLPEGAALPSGVYPSSPENPPPCGPTLTILLEGVVGWNGEVES
jgi:hypothetical protein